MPRIPITQKMVECTESEIRNNEIPDRETAAKCLGDPRRTDTGSDMRRSLWIEEGSKDWRTASMPTERQANLGKKLNAEITCMACDVEVVASMEWTNPSLC